VVIFSHNDDAVVAAFTPELAAARHLLTEEEQRHVDQAQRSAAIRERVRAAIAADNLEDALRIEREARVPIIDRVLSTAKRRYLALHEPRAVVAYERPGRLEVYWEWPTSPLIEVMTVVYRRGQPPGLPALSQRDPETLLGRTTRGEYERLGRFNAPITGPGPWHVRVFSSYHDQIHGRRLDQQEASWAYSPGGAAAVSEQ